MKFLACVVTALVVHQAVAQDNAVQPINYLNPVQPQPMQSKIVGGSDADTGEFPFFVQGSGCGASLIGKKYPKPTRQYPSNVRQNTNILSPP
jgi:secreted trypsin-like serine protease